MADIKKENPAKQSPGVSVTIDQLKQQLALVAQQRRQAEVTFYQLQGREALLANWVETAEKAIAANQPVPQAESAVVVENGPDEGSGPVEPK